MNAFELYKLDGTATNIFACGKCGIVFGGTYWPDAKGAAEKCCGSSVCNRCGAELTHKGYLICRACQIVDTAEKLREDFEKAEKVTDWDGAFYSEPFNKYFFDMDELEEWLDDYDPKYYGGMSAPIWLFTCVAAPPCPLDIEDIMERATEDMFEDAADHFTGIDDLQKAIDAFNEANKDVLTYFPNRKKVYLVKQEETDER